MTLTLFIKHLFRLPANKRHDRLFSDIRCEYRFTCQLCGTKKFTISFFSRPLYAVAIVQKEKACLKQQLISPVRKDETKGDILLRLTHRFGSYGVIATGGQNFGREAGAAAGTRVWYEKNEGSNRLALGGGVNADTTTRSISSDADWRNDFGQVHGSIQHSSGDNGPSTGYGGNFPLTLHNWINDSYWRQSNG